MCKILHHHRLSRQLSSSRPPHMAACHRTTRPPTTRSGLPHRHRDLHNGWSETPVFIGELNGIGSLRSEQTGQVDLRQRRNLVPVLGLHHRPGLVGPGQQQRLVTPLRPHRRALPAYAAGATPSATSRNHVESPACGPGSRALPWVAAARPASF